MLDKLESLLSIKACPSQVSRLLSTDPLNLYNAVFSYYRDKYKIFLSSLENDDLLGLALFMYCDNKNINLEDEILDFYYDLIMQKKYKDGELLEYLIKENEELRSKVEVENEFIKEAWYEMFINKQT